MRSCFPVHCRDGTGVDLVGIGIVLCRMVSRLQVEGRAQEGALTENHQTKPTETTNIKARTLERCCRVEGMVGLYGALIASASELPLVR